MLPSKPDAMKMQNSTIPQEALFEFLQKPRTAKEVAARFGTQVETARARMRSYGRYIRREGPAWALISVWDELNGVA